MTHKVIGDKVDLMAEDELQKEIEELLTQLVVDIHSKTVQGGLLLPDATIFMATDKILTLYNAYTTNKIIERLETLKDWALDMYEPNSQGRMVIIEIDDHIDRIKALNHRKEKHD